ncbi:hypothetical protein AB0M50_20035 [Nonomuraea fuscirosea]|uniref:hypothetical protein n=1 Tax=Nonomuraea fuscirosea TaxID=1291556 RepID=UPI0034204D1D
MPLLTIATDEWDASRIPYENQAAASSTGYGYPDPSNPATVQIGRGHNQLSTSARQRRSIRTPS